MKKVSIYVENARLTPSSYYRLTQYFSPSEARFHSALPDGLYHWWHNHGKTGGFFFSVFLYVFYVFRTLGFLLADCFTMKGGTVILARAIVPRRLPFVHKYLIRRLARRNEIVWDFDDNILANKRISPTDFYFHSKYSDRIVVSTEILSSLIDKSFAHKVSILPTTDGDMLGYDTERLLSQRQQLYKDEVRLVWAGTALGLEYIQPIVPVLDHAAKALQERYGKKLSLHVVCNKPLDASTSSLHLVNVVWEREVARQEIASAHIGIMPLPDTDFTRGKGGFKLIQYMSVSLPVIASSVGFNQHVVADGTGYLVDDSHTTSGWEAAILHLATDWEHYLSMAQRAKEQYNTSFSFDTAQRFWQGITQRKLLLMVVNEDRFFLSHRKDIALTAQNDGWDVKIVCKDTGRRREVEALGLEMIELPINPTGTNLLQELKTYRFLKKLYAKHQDAVVHHVGMKLILWGGLAARRSGVKGVVNAVSGLGVMFSSEKLSLMARGILLAMRYAHHRGNVVDIFQNHEDEQLFVQHHISRPQGIQLIKGSGIDLSLFAYHPQPAGQPVKVLFTGRMVEEKGVIVLVEAAELLRPAYEGRVQFLLCGMLSTNPKAIGREQLEALCDGHYIQWLGYRDDIREQLIASHIMAFPSYYREGVPKSLIEACAIGRPIVTTRSIGCKDTVSDGVNGFLVPVRDSRSLADKLRLLIDDPSLREKMGLASRKKAELEFQLESVIRRHMEIYERLYRANNN